MSLARHAYSVMDGLMQQGSNDERQLKACRAYGIEWATLPLGRHCSVLWKNISLVGEG